MNKPKICAVVTGDNLEEFCQNLESIQTIDGIDLLELRADYISGIEVNQLTHIKQFVQLPAIITCRHERHGGKFPEDDTNQLLLLQEAIDLGFEYIDIDLDIYHAMIIDKKQTKTIISHHNFERTPSIDQLEVIATQMNQTDADIHKYAMMVNSDDDLKRLMSFLINYPSSKEKIVIGMGEAGKASRIIGPLLGSYLTFGSTDTSSTAPGQIDVGSLREIYRSI